MTEHKRIENGAIVETLHQLPERITLSTGQTITGFNTLPPEALKSLGYLPVIRDPINHETHTLQSTPEITADTVIYHAIPRNINALKAMTNDQINQASGETRARFIPQGQMQDQEYLLAQKHAEQYKAAGYPADAIPASIQASMDANENTAQQEADGILAEAEKLETLLTVIRKIRMTANATINAVQDDNEQIITLRDTALAELNAL